LLTKTRVDPDAEHRCPWIEGYCSRSSVQAGETLSFHISTNPPSPFTIELFRMGYYGGDGGRCVAVLGDLQGQRQSDPPAGPGRLRECHWQASTEIQIAESWLSGVYLGKLTAHRSGIQSYLIFVVRDQRTADYIFQCSDLTWQAYNRWPKQCSLYDDGKKPWCYAPDIDVSLDRPYGKYCQIVDAPLSIGSGEWLLWEFPLDFWLQSKGYDVTYVSGIDTHSGRAALGRSKGLLSVGHDEYYTMAQFAHLKRAIAEGLGVAFLSANTCHGLIGLRPASDGRVDRVMTRLDVFGRRQPLLERRFPEMGRFPWRAPDEGTLVGARSIAPIVGRGDWTCAAPDHWIFAGTGMKQGESIPGLVGWEFQGDPAAIEDLDIVASGPTHHPRGDGTYTATVYEGPHGNIVFNAATCWWADGISEPPGYVRPTEYTSLKGPDPRVQRMTENVLARLRNGSAVRGVGRATEGRADPIGHASALKEALADRTAR
jgi:hypothetical protein